MAKLALIVIIVSTTVIFAAIAKYRTPTKPEFSDHRTDNDDPYLSDYYDDAEYPVLPNELDHFNPKLPGGLLRGPAKRPALRPNEIRPKTTAKPKTLDADRRPIEPTDPKHQFQVLGSVEGCRRVGQDRLNHAGTVSSITNRYSGATAATIEMMEPVYVAGKFGYETVGNNLKKVTYQTDSYVKTSLQFVWYAC